MQLTWRQFSGYLHQARRRAARARLDRISDMRAAMHGGDNAAAMIRALNDQASDKAGA